MYCITITYHLMDSSWEDAENLRVELRGLGFSAPQTRTESGLVERTVVGMFDYPSATEARDFMRRQLNSIFAKFDLEGRAMVSVSEHNEPPPALETTLEYIAS